MNAIESSFAAALAAAFAFFAGCETVSVESYRQDRFNPLISVSETGIRFQGEPILPEDAPKRLKKLGVPKKEPVYVRVDNGYDLTPAGRRALWVFRDKYLIRAGYSRVVMTHPVKSESGSVEEVGTEFKSGSIPVGSRPGRVRRGFR